MPFKVTYRICSAGKDAPFFTTTDKRLATVEFHEQQRTKGMLSVRMRTDVQPTGRLSKQEEYLWLVYRVRQAIHRYYDRRNKVSVPGLLSLGKKKGDKEGPFVGWIRDAFEDAGYEMEYAVHNAADYGVPQNRKRVIFVGTRQGVEKWKFPKGVYGDGPGQIPYMSVLEAIGELPPIKAGQWWGVDTYHPYGYNKVDGYVICPRCLKYNKEERPHCIHCGMPLDHPITGGVVRLPGLGTLLDTKVAVDNELMRKYNLLNV